MYPKDTFNGLEIYLKTEEAPIFHPGGCGRDTFNFQII
jgi:hypothetical protein